MFNFRKTEIDGVYIIEPMVYGDNRGYFFETYNLHDFEINGITYNFVQDNESKSKRNVLRGLHFQKNFPQTKLLRVIEGEIFDVAVDLRKDSKTFGKYVGTILSSENKKMILIPKGFAHGFLVLSETAVVSYKCDDFYHPGDEVGIIWNDKTLSINWPLNTKPILSDKDQKNIGFESYLSLFKNE